MLKALGLDHFLDHLNGHARRLIFGNMINAIGMGLTMTLFLVYLHTIRGFSGGFSGLVMSFMAVFSMVINPLIGILIDKYGGRIVLIFGLFIKAVGVFSLAFVESKPQVIGIATILAIGDSANWPAQTVCPSGARGFGGRRAVTPARGPDDPTSRVSDHGDGLSRSLSRDAGPGAAACRLYLRERRPHCR